ncbi:MAG: hypothetical protein K0S65_3179 [Labilithrix sp.]|nr:hypothetical protein [Labilithrix sp.]
MTTMHSCNGPAAAIVSPDVERKCPVRTRDEKLGTKVDRLRERLDKVLERAVAEPRIVGSVVVVLHDGMCIYQRAGGLAARVAARPISVDTVFRLASVTKPFVSIATLQLVESGALDLDAPITRYLPEFRPSLADGRAPSPTVRQLLTHTAGLSYGHMEPLAGPYHAHGVSDGLDAPGLSMNEELRRIVAAGLRAPPGTQWIYSVALDVLGAAIERVLGKPLSLAVRELIGRPLELVDTGFEAPEKERLATPYADGAPPVRMQEPHAVPFFDASEVRFSPARVFDAASFASGGAGMNGTAIEVARLLETVRRGGGSLLPEKAARAMMTNQIGDLPIVLGPGWGFGFGGAVLVDRDAANTPQSPGTWTWGGAWGHNWFVDPALRLVAVALTNTALEGMMGLFPSAVRDAIYASLTR